MLFSEPKIPQYPRQLSRVPMPLSFSALQRAENSSIVGEHIEPYLWIGFSALQRAENSSIPCVVTLGASLHKFQCSSASRKFLNVSATYEPALCVWFQCSSASRKFLNVNYRTYSPLDGWFQCSSASRKFLNFAVWLRFEANPSVSVLFSEPKIPQSATFRVAYAFPSRFSALQRAENSSIQVPKPC